MQASAVFLGSATGWLRGRRKAVVQAGRARPDLVHAGINGLLHELSEADREAFGTEERLTLQEQVCMQCSRSHPVDGSIGHACSSGTVGHFSATDKEVLAVTLRLMLWDGHLLAPVVVATMQAYYSMSSLPK